MKENVLFYSINILCLVRNENTFVNDRSDNQVLRCDGLFSHVQYFPFTTTQEVIKKILPSAIFTVDFFRKMLYEEANKI